MSQINNTNSLLISTSLNSLWNFSNEEYSETDSSSTVSASNSSYASKQAQSAYGMQQIDKLAEAMEAVMEGLGLSAGNRVTFSTITNYTETMKDELAQKVKDGLSELGIPKDTEYQVVTDYENDGIKVITDSPDKAKIEQFFRDNPELVEEFKQVQYLDNLEVARTSQDIALHLEISRIELQSMSGLFNTNPSSSIMSYGEDGSYFGMGLSAII